MGCDDSKEKVPFKDCSDDCRQIVVYSKRYVKQGQMEDFKKAYCDAWKVLQDKVATMSSLMFSIDKSDPNCVHDIQVFADIDTYLAHVDSNDRGIFSAVMGFARYYDTSVHPFTGVFFGGWDMRAQAIMKKFGAQYTFVKSMAGFMRGATLDRCGPPTIVVSQRRVKAGKMASLI
jgi:hypothetical protein